MEPLAISWLITSSSSPLVAVLALWTIYVFHTYRRRWRTVDLFLLAVTSQELVTSVFTFCYAIISLINPPFKAPCSFTHWGMVATRTFQIATLTSMVADRALTVQWPYRYRFSVRRNQIRYHVAVLALVSTLVGIASVFATLPDDKVPNVIIDNVTQGKLPNKDNCRLHPAQWDIKFVIFLLSLFAALILLSLICMIQVEIHRSKHGTKLAANGSFQLPECASPDLPSATGMNSPLDTHSSTGSTRALHRPSRQASRRPYGKNAKGTSDLRWQSVALTALVCYSLNHIPHLVLLSLSAWSPDLWSPWHEAILCWLGLLEGMFVPLLLFCRDAALRSALRRTFQRRSGALSPLVGDDGPFQMYFDKDHFRKRGTFGSVTPIGIITNYRRAPGKRARSVGKGYALQSGDSVSRFIGAQPLSKLSCADLTSLEMWREEDEENFYATLSDDFSTFSCESGDESAPSEDLREELYGGSFTTLANDDFEFHDTRPCGGEVRMKPALVSPVVEGVSRNVSFRGSIVKKESPSRNISYDKDDLFQLSSKVEIDDIQKDPKLFAESVPEWAQQYDTPIHTSSSPSEDLGNTPPRDNFGSMARRQKSTSYSMNDLDLIHRGGGLAGQDFETTFILPVKSESTMSLYRLNVERDLDQMAMTPSKSETNVNGDSGFGSGAQSTNPVWSGFLCRKPSDPFWNIRKPSTAAVTPTRNYPGILHPRMRKIPWISAWKKLDENSERQVIHDSHLKDNKVGWKENVVYTAQVETMKPLDNQVIDEELSDVNSPLFGEDYNLNIFAKESGVLLENAYGKIVRDDRGVKVNFYGENVQYDAKDNIYGNKDPSDYVFESSFESDKQIYDHNQDLLNFRVDSNKIENHYEPLNVFKNGNHSAIIGNVDAITQSPDCCEDLVNANDLFKCEMRLNGGHYENLFGTKENIFAQCDLYRDKGKIEPDPNSDRLERRASGRRDSGRFKSPNNAFYYPETDCPYGRLKKVDRKESFSRKNDEVESRNLKRKESDNRGKKSVVKRRDSRNRLDKRSEIPKLKELSPSSHFPQFENKDKTYDEDASRNRIEIEMKNVYGRNDLNCNSRVGKIENREDICGNLNRRESFNNRNRDNSYEKRNLQPGRCLDLNLNADKVRKSRLERKGSQSRERRRSLERKDSFHQVPVEVKDNLWKINVGYNDNAKYSNIERRNSDRRTNVERRDSDRRMHVERQDSGRQLDERKANLFQANIERKDSGRQDKIGKSQPSKAVCRRDSQNKNSEAKSEGLWVNAIPFQKPSAEKEDAGNARRESRKEAYDLRRSPRKANLTRKESRSRNEKPGEHVKRKVSGNRGKREKEDIQNDHEMGNKVAKKEYTNWSRGNGDDKWAHHQESDVRCESKFDDFAKYRDKCEGNFTHLQNVNRETSTERESARVDQIFSYGKLNGNVPQVSDGLLHDDTYQEHRRIPVLASSKPAYDVNENCRQKKLAITDFL